MNNNNLQKEDNIIYLNRASKKQTNGIRPYGIIAIMAVLLTLVSVGAARFCDFPITVGVIAVNLLIFILIKMGKMIVRQLGSSYITTIYDKEYYRIISSAFTHEEPLHIICNMYSLYNLGNALEDFLGPVYFAVSYILLTLVGGLISCLVKKKRSPQILSIGASGVLCGFLGIYAVLVVAFIGLSGIKSLLPTLFILALMTGSKRIDSIGHFVGLGVGILWGIALLFLT